MTKQIPNILTGSRLLFTAGFLVLAAQADLGDPDHLSAADRTRMLWAVILFIIGAITDAFDGALARRWHVTSAFGRWFDPLVDKIQIIGAFILLAFKPHTGIAWWMVAVIIAREGLVTWIRSLCEARGIAFGAVWTGKIKMILQTVTVCVVMVQVAFCHAFAWTFYFRQFCIWLTVGFTAWSAVAYVLRYRSILNAAN